MAWHGTWHFPDPWDDGHTFAILSLHVTRAVHYHSTGFSLRDGLRHVCSGLVSAIHLVCFVLLPDSTVTLIDRHATIPNPPGFLRLDVRPPAYTPVDPILTLSAFLAKVVSLEDG